MSGIGASGGSGGQKGFRGMDADRLPPLGDHAGPVPTAQYPARGELADIRQAPKLFVSNVNIDPPGMDTTAAASNIDKSPRNTMTRLAFEKAAMPVRQCPQHLKGNTQSVRPDGRIAVGLLSNLLMTPDD
jgi:hypothetical protein